MTSALGEPTDGVPATESQVRAHARELIELAALHGITDLAYASRGRLRGRVDDDHDLFDVFEFQRAAGELVGAEIVVYSAGALANEHVSSDLQSAIAL